MVIFYGAEISLPNARQFLFMVKYDTEDWWVWLDLNKRPPLGTLQIIKQSRTSSVGNICRVKVARVNIHKGFKVFNTPL
jgi:hypothetical protein